MSRNQLFVLGIPVDRAEDYWAEAKQLEGGHIVTLNAEMVMLARENPTLKKIITQAELVVPDGSGVVLYGRYLGHKIDRCPGIELAAKMLNYAHENQLKVFFVGASPDVAQKNLSHWQQKLPDLIIAGCHDGYFNPTKEQQILAEIRQTRPGLILVALGVPKQELWIDQHRSICPGALWMGIGGSFDVWAGTKKRAPQWVGNIHLEWLYRLIQEPWRYRRMLVLPRFVWQALREFLTQNK